MNSEGKSGAEEEAVDKSFVEGKIEIMGFVWRRKRETVRRAMRSIETNTVVPLTRITDMGRGMMVIATKCNALRSAYGAF